MLTTDYLETTEPDALARLLDLAEDATGRLAGQGLLRRDDEFSPEGLPLLLLDHGDSRSLVGSSNLSRSGIALGVEWTLVTDLDAVWQPRSNGSGTTVETPP